MAYAEIAQMLGVSRKRAHEILRKPDFPDPIATLSVGRGNTRDGVSRVSTGARESGSRSPTS